jgi:hypothetical protein
LVTLKTITRHSLIKALPSLQQKSFNVSVRISFALLLDHCNRKQLWKKRLLYRLFGKITPDPFPLSGAIMGASPRITVKDPLGQKPEYFYNGVVGYGWYVSPRDYVEYEDESKNDSAATATKTVNYPN